MMKLFRSGALPGLVTFLMIAVFVSIACGQEYIQANTKIAGKEIHAFTDGGKNVTIILGSFSLTIGERVITGRDAVLWINTHNTTRIPR